MIVVVAITFFTTTHQRRRWQPLPWSYSFQGKRKMKKVTIASCRRLLPNNTTREEDNDNNVSFFSQAFSQVEKKKESLLPSLYLQQIHCSKAIEECYGSSRHLLLWWCCYEKGNDKCCHLFLKFHFNKNRWKKGHILCNKTSNKTIEKNEEKGESLPSSSYFYPLVFSLLLPLLAPTFSLPLLPSHFKCLFLAPTFAVLFQVPTSSFKFLAMEWVQNEVR